MNVIKIGRADDNNIRVPESFIRVSNYHSDILLEGGKLLYCDHSTNGTIINNQKIKNMRVHVFQGDRIDLPGGYSISWDEINKYFDPVQRPAIHRNPHDVEHRYSLDGSIVTDSVPLPSEVSGKIKVRDAESNSLGNKTVRMQQPDFEERKTLRKNPVDSLGKDAESSSLGLYGSLGGSRADGGLTDEEIKQKLGRWNWGAFFLTWVWGLIHKAPWTLVFLILPLYIACIAFLFPYGMGECLFASILFILLSLAYIALAIYLGFNGTKIAWNNGCFNSVVHACESIRKWNIAGFVVFALGLAAYILMCENFN